MMDKQEEKNPGALELVLAFIVPVMGVILYFLMRKHEKRARNYLYAAGAGFFFPIILFAVLEILFKLYK